MFRVICLQKSKLSKTTKFSYFANNQKRKSQKSIGLSVNCIMKSKKFSFVLIGRIISIGLQGIFYLIFATLLEPEQYGNLSYLISLAGTFAVVSRFGLNHTVIVQQAKQNHLLANQINILFLIFTVVASIFLLAINVFAALLCLATSFFIMNIYNQIGIKEYKRYFWLNVTKGLLIIIIPIPMYYIFDLPGILLGMSIGYLLSSFNFIKSLQINFELKKLKEHYLVIIHNFGVDSSNQLGKFVDKLLIAPLMGFTTLGIYQLNIQILFALEVFPIALHSFLLSEESSGKTHKKISLVIIVASCFIVILVILFSPFFIDTFFPKYSEGILGLQILIISLVPLTVSAIFNAKLQAEESTKIGYSAIVRIASLLLLIALLSETYGLIGLSLSVLISTSLNTGFLFFIFRRHKFKH